MPCARRLSQMAASKCQALSFSNTIHSQKWHNYLPASPRSILINMTYCLVRKLNNYENGQNTVNSLINLRTREASCKMCARSMLRDKENRKQRHETMKLTDFPNQSPSTNYILMNYNIIILLTKCERDLITHAEQLSEKYDVVVWLHSKLMHPIRGINRCLRVYPIRK